MTHQYKSTTHREKFFHTQTNTPYLRIKGATVFAREEADGWWAASSLCSAGDNFCRSTGRDLARRRYFQKGDIIYLGDEPNGERLSEVAALAILQHA